MNSNSIGNNILFEDNHLIIFNKQPSQIVQGDKTGDTPLSDLIKEFIKERDHKPGNVFLGVVHRIDRPVSGVVVFAKTSKALSRLERNDQNRPDPENLLGSCQKSTTRSKRSSYFITSKRTKKKINLLPMRRK